jgi:hypothetical protein
VKFVSILMISLFSVLAAAAPQCGAPLAERAFCASANGDAKRIAFKSDCSVAYVMNFASGETVSFEGTWSLNGTLLTFDIGTEVAPLNLIFAPDMNSFSVEGHPQDVYSSCK